MRKNSAVLRLGFIPTRRGMSGEKAFNREVALKEKRAILDYIRRYPIEIVDLEGKRRRNALRRTSDRRSRPEDDRRQC